MADHDSPYASTQPMHRDFPVGHKCARSSSLLPPPRSLSGADRLRLKTNFSRAFNPMTPVQISREKYSALRSAKISRILLASRLVQRGVSRSSRTWRREAVDARDRSILLNADERSLRGRPKPCGPGAPTL